MHLSLSLSLFLTISYIIDTSCRMCDEGRRNTLLPVLILHFMRRPSRLPLVWPDLRDGSWPFLKTIWGWSRGYWRSGGPRLRWWYWCSAAQHFWARASQADLWCCQRIRRADTEAAQLRLGSHGNAKWREARIRYYGLADREHQPVEGLPSETCSTLSGFLDGPCGEWGAILCANQEIESKGSSNCKQAFGGVRANLPIQHKGTYCSRIHDAACSSFEQDLPPGDGRIDSRAPHGNLGPWPQRFLQPVVCWGAWH